MKRGVATIGADMKYLAILLLLWVSIVLIGAAGWKSGATHERKTKYSSIVIHNPFDSSFKIDLKCNWNGKKWSSIKRYKLKARDGTEIKVPNSSRCQIWPVF